MQSTKPHHGKSDINSLIHKNSYSRTCASLNEISLIEKEIIVNKIIRKEKKNRIHKRNRKEKDKEDEDDQEN